VWKNCERQSQRTEGVRTHDVCGIVRLSCGTCQRILSHELNIAAKFVPRQLNSCRKEHRFAVCSELKEQTGNDHNSISTIITGLWTQPWDETAIISVEAAQESMIMTGQIDGDFFCTEIITHKELVQPVHTVTGSFSFDVRRRLRLKRPAQRSRKMKLKLEGRSSVSTEDIQTESQDGMKILTENDFHQSFR
jgi:hypothetical protein